MPKCIFHVFCRDVLILTIIVRNATKCYKCDNFSWQLWCTLGYGSLCSLARPSALAPLSARPLGPAVPASAPRRSPALVSISRFVHCLLACGVLARLVARLAVESRMGTNHQCTKCCKKKAVWVATQRHLMSTGLPTNQNTWR